MHAQQRSAAANPSTIKPGTLAWMVDPGRWVVKYADRELFDRKLRSFVPPDIFDVHAHLYDCRHLAPEVPADGWTGLFRGSLAVRVARARG